ncbi:TetR/AcrR family transcriptional regulator [Leifsonia virtsii]|uniref:Helix-turn-helix domain containing protein n=1 Tax=Leifsonia virtsii TaxID=3035915 RepID=A0ABT8J0T3_9MICO|nr:TetR/AcrR family transcriptional regulator [Leifsonia virtsii]MDN4598231.1 helix-turn-helix domain containing protein [Leifsonia virtsii]
MQTFLSPSESLRDRKKAQVRADLERAALELALERDLDEVTVDEICARIPVSHRTFFNYFDTKEDALFDVRRAWGDPEWFARRLAEAYEGSVVGAVVAALFPHEETGGDQRMREARMLIAARHPGLIRRKAGRLEELRAGLVEVVAAFVAERDPASAEAAAALGIDPDAQAELLVVACVGAVRIAVREWAEQGANATEEQVKTRAVAVARALAPALG